MPSLKQIRRRISSVKNTKQITRAMKLVSAAKLRRAQDSAENGRAYIRHLMRILGELIPDLPEGFTHELLSARPAVRNRCVILLAGERGLCGPFNTNILKAVQAQMVSEGSAAVIPIGRRAVAGARRFGWEAIAEYESLPEDVRRWPIEDLARRITAEFAAEKYDEVILYYTTFVTAMSQRVTREVILPLASLSEPPDGSAAVSGKDSPEPRRVQPGMLEHHPDAETIFRNVIPLLLKARFRQAALESKASEHAARMMAMDSATSNANDLIERLRLYYNRARQGAITRELIDIVGGAEALT